MEILKLIWQSNLALQTNYKENIIMKKPLFGSYVVYQYCTDSEDNKTEEFFAIALVLSEITAIQLCKDDDLKFYEEENILVNYKHSY